MSRLDSFIRRLEAQRACINAALSLIEARDLSGPILELGLGNGRTYNHLREKAVGREIFVFDRQLAAHPYSMPPADHFFMGDLFETLPLAAQRLDKAALAHIDIGSGDDAANKLLTRQIAPLIAAMLSPGGIVLSDQPLACSAFDRLSLPETVPEGRYYMAVFESAPRNSIKEADWLRAGI